MTLIYLSGLHLVLKLINPLTLTVQPAGAGEDKVARRPLTTAEAARLIVYQNRVDWWGAFTVQYRGRWPVARATTSYS